MADVKSKLLNQRDSTSVKSMLDPIETVGRLKEVLGVQQISTQSAGDTIRLIAVPSSARISELSYARDTLGTSSLDVAAFYPTNIPQGGLNAPAASSESALISSSAFATALAGTDLGVDWTSAMSTTSAPTLQKRTQPLWQLLGLSADPVCDIDLGFTVRTANAEAGYVGLRARFID